MGKTIPFPTQMQHQVAVLFGGRWIWQATLFLIDSKGEIVVTQSVGDTCGKQELFFDDFVEPTPSPTVSPSYSPTTSLNPTSSLVDDFSWVGEGSCVDESYNYYSSYISEGVPDGINTTDYTPPAYSLDDYFNGTGAILASDGYDYAVCYRYDVRISGVIPVAQILTPLHCASS